MIFEIQNAVPGHLREMFQNLQRELFSLSVVSKSLENILFGAKC